jgi:hypothetical protein
MSFADTVLEGRDLRESLESYVYQLDLQCDSQIDDLASLVPLRDVERLRAEHYAWRVWRDVSCAHAGRDSSDPLAELNCRSDATGAYFDRRELEIAELEERISRSAEQR